MTPSCPWEVSRHLIATAHFSQAALTHAPVNAVEALRSIRIAHACLERAELAIRTTLPIESASS